MKNVKNMKLLTKVADRFQSINQYSRKVMLVSLFMGLSFYITALFAFQIAPYVNNYFSALLVYRSCLEAAPATIAAGVTAALICDLIVAKSREKS